ncbi:MAG: hypothetical protein KME21_10630 [Desmonostoc vinosum HA7617-LM4]|jgi:HEAT repeat protein|nr:hypothetical protein [Desmonostoc vinosum HA7617-LM4]
MNPDQRLSDIRYDLKTALDSEEEYLEEGAMGTYWPKSYATYAAEQLKSLFKASEPTTAEIACCVEAISDPERISKGRSKKLLLQLGEQSRPILDALANSTDPQLRIFAVETANTSVNPSYFNPLYWGINLEQQLLNDPDENVRIATILALKPAIAHNARYIQMSLQKRINNGMTNLFHQLLARLNDTSAKVRTAAAEVLCVWKTAI